MPAAMKRQKEIKPTSNKSTTTAKPQPVYSNKKREREICYFTWEYFNFPIFLRKQYNKL